MKRFFSFLLLFCVALVATAQQMYAPKREFRGAWIQFINGQFQGMHRDSMQANLTRQLDVLKSCGVNTIIFQVRGEADAFYESKYEPWSRFLTGQQGTPPNPYWDPLAWMVEECHRRGMELHAWINPYRAKTKNTHLLAATHPYNRYPDRFFEYDGLYIFDPALPENRDYICGIVADIVGRYDVDGLHIDDYFYPYPAADATIDDEASFRKYGGKFERKDDWRRDNVNKFIEQLYKTVHDVKPWVKVGIAPFGIYHNAKNGGEVPGSRTNGLQNYDDLYADVLLWVKKGWLDYNVPQIYWEIGHKAADYTTLVKWWAEHANRRPLIIGQDVERTVRAADLRRSTESQMAEKFRVQRFTDGVQGSCLWYSAAVVRNEGGYADALRRYYHRTPALQPLMPHLDNKSPKKPRKLETLWMPDGFYLFWTAPKAKSLMDKAHKYVVYCFEKGEKIDLERADRIVAITLHTMLQLPYVDGTRRYTYVVTALDRLQNESPLAKKKVKL